MSEKTGYSISQIWRAVQEGWLLPTNSVVKPCLSQKHKLKRMEFVLDHIKSDGTFHDMYDTVHIDEKWFYMDKEKLKYYLLPREKPPNRSVKARDTERK